MVSTNSVDFNAVSIRDLIWIETAYSFILKYKQLEQADKKFLLFDLANMYRAKASCGKQSSLLKITDLPSFKIKQSQKEYTVEQKKKFLLSLNKK